MRATIAKDKRLEKNIKALKLRIAKLEAKNKVKDKK